MWGRARACYSPLPWSDNVTAALFLSHKWTHTHPYNLLAINNNVMSPSYHTLLLLHFPFSTYSTILILVPAAIRLQSQVAKIVVAACIPSSLHNSKERRAVEWEVGEQNQNTSHTIHTQQGETNRASTTTLVATMSGPIRQF